MKVVTTLLVFFLSLVCLISYGDTDAQAEVIAYDAEGQFLGVLLSSTGGTANIFMPSTEMIISIPYNSGDALLGFLYYKSYNCSGTPYMDVQSSYDIKKVGDNYYIGEKVAPVNMRMNSQLAHRDLKCNRAGYDRDVVPSIEIDPPISLPVALPLSFEHEPAHPGKRK